MEAGEVALGLRLSNIFIRPGQQGVLVRVDHSGEPVLATYVQRGCRKGLLGVKGHGFFSGHSAGWWVAAG